MTPAIYILCGIPFAGKTTLAHTLAMQRGWTHVEVDAIVESLMDSSDSEVIEEQWTEAFATSKEQIAANLARGQSVVYDATNWGRTGRDQVRAIAHQFGSSAHVVPIEKADRRRRANQAQPQRHQGDKQDGGEIGTDRLAKDAHKARNGGEPVRFYGMLDGVRVRF